jgi:hypothetical protein
MTIDYPVRSNQYQFLIGKPRAWQLLFLLAAPVFIGDEIKLIELDNDGNPTGNVVFGEVIFLNTAVSSVLFDNYKLVFVKPI